MEAVHDWAREHEYESIRFECHNQHRPMLHLGIALGYDIVGIRWDPDRGANLVLFQKTLVRQSANSVLADQSPKPSANRVCVHLCRFLYFQEILEQLRSFERQKTLRVELHAVQRPGAVPHAHDLAFLGPGGDTKSGL